MYTVLTRVRGVRLFEGAFFSHTNARKNARVHMHLYMFTW